MFARIDDFVSAWENHTKTTRAIFGALTDESLSRAVGDGHRDLGRVAWHIVQTIPEMLGQVGLEAKGPAEHVPVPESAAAIADAYREAGESVLTEVREKWTDETLEVEDEMYGSRWKRGFTLFAFLSHEVHHRGQMTVLLRQAGLRVPGAYGPAKEEWGDYGMEPPAI